VTTRSFARLVSSSFDRLVTVDPHLHRYPALSALYTIPAEALHAAPLLADWIAAEVDQPVIVGPDEESEQWVSAIASRIGAPHAVLRKVRRLKLFADRIVSSDSISHESNAIQLAPLIVAAIASAEMAREDIVRHRRLLEPGDEVSGVE
jgi:hypothetical protein